MASIIQHLNRGFSMTLTLSEMVAETAKASKDQQTESATGENNTCTIRVQPEFDGRTIGIGHCLIIVSSVLSKLNSNVLPSRQILHSLRHPV